MRTLGLILLFLCPHLISQAEPIDREALFRRHNPVLNSADTLSALSLGNGSFAFTVDITGLQSFPQHYGETGLPLSTLSEWGWHSEPNPNGYRIEQTFRDFDTQGRTVPYPYEQATEAGQWLRGNPHRLGLGTLGLSLLSQEGEQLSLESINSIHQRLDLWTGTLTSTFEIDGQTVRVTTVCHPEHDTIATRIESPLVETGELQLSLKFAYGSSAWGIVPEDWDHPEKHQSSWDEQHQSVFRKVDDTQYRVNLAGDVKLTQLDAHHFQIQSLDTALTLAVTYTADTAETRAPSFEESLQASQSYWPAYWAAGGVVDLSQCTDPRAAELERRIVLSQYLTAIQCRGALPPQETGLSFNSWYGKPHLEMHWWHATHFALWNRPEVLKNAMGWYESILPKAREIAETQGYEGARWPKNVDKDGNQVPSSIAPLLIWQQPHPIYFAELLYRSEPNDATLQRYQSLVEETAQFMASYPHFDDKSQSYHLGPPLIPAQESYDPTTTRNPTFELAYWRWALEIAQQWRVRQRLERNPYWDELLDNFTPYPHFDDRYATAQDVWNDVDHPSVVAAFGMINGPEIDPERMSNTLAEVMENWPWHHTWGWDYPMIAMTAARLGQTETALEALLLDVQKNRYLPNGHNFQTQDRLRIYLPGNGGLLAAIAMMAAGWDGAPEIDSPGFPQNGQWKVRWEGLSPMP